MNLRPFHLVAVVCFVIAFVLIEYGAGLMGICTAWMRYAGCLQYKYGGLGALLALIGVLVALIGTYMLAKPTDERLPTYVPPEALPGGHRISHRTVRRSRIILFAVIAFFIIFAEAIMMFRFPIGYWTSQGTFVFDSGFLFDLALVAVVDFFIIYMLAFYIVPY